ncbi:MAG: VCBS repeat-containing protein [Myxococcales bacterium]
MGRSRGFSLVRHPSGRRGRALPAAVALTVAVSTTLLAGCNWATFGHDADKAPVRSIEAPSSFKGNDFGRAVLPLSDGQGSAAAFVASSINDNTIAVVTIDTSGAVNSRALPGTALHDTEDSVISSLAEDRGGGALGLLLGTPKIHNQGYGRIYTYPLTAMLEGNVTTKPVASLPPEEGGLGRGVAVGHLGGMVNLNDYAVASDDHLVVLVDGTTATPPEVVGAAGCDTTFDPNQDARYRLRRALLSASLWAPALADKTEQLVATSPHPTGTPGKLSIFSVTGSGSAFSLNCLTTITAPGPELVPRFGSSLASADFDGDGNLDLLVGAPGQHAYVFRGPFAGAVPTPITISDPEGVDFGYAVAALDLDGNGAAEALIGDPYATVDGQERAGRVTAYSWNATTKSMETMRVYSDHSPEANANFGSTVNSLPFCTSPTSPAAGMPCSDQDSARVLMVGASNEVFVYFREGNKGGKKLTDVRAP